MNGASYEVGYLPHGRELPPGWSIVPGLERTHHGHHARMIRRDRPDVKPFRFWLCFWRLGCWRPIDGAEPFLWTCYGAMPSIETGRETEFLIGAVVDAKSHEEAMRAVRDRFGHVTVLFGAPKPDGWLPQSAKQMPAADV